MSPLRRAWLLATAVAVVTACSGPAEPPVETVTYNIDRARISVSGLSSGAHMATQLHVAHSAVFNGAAVISGGPYYCAEGSLNRGIGPCLQGGDVPVERFIAYAREMAAAGKIDPLANLADDRVWVFHGALDDVVSAELAAAARDFYARLIRPEAVTAVDDVPAVHGMPTLATGPACDTFETPFLNACNYDAAGELLAALHGGLRPRAAANGALLTIAQPGAGDAEMLEEAYLYVPAECAAGESCGVHVAIHGCTQSSEFVGDAFAAGAGFNEWADGNRLLVLYPQVARSSVAPMNPYGCWDWWGYTGADYATQSGPQISVIKNMLDRLAGTAL